MKSPWFTCFALLAGTTSAADLTALGAWMETITAADLASGAGSNIRSPIESVSGVTLLDLSNTSGSWRVLARRTGSSWNGALTLWVKRSSAGSGSGDVSGGEAYVALSSSDTEIFRGTGDRSGISLQLKLTGLTSGTNPNTYLSSIIFTIQ